MAQHNDFIFSSIIKVLEEGVNAVSLNNDGIESYSLNEYIMKTIFLKMTGFQEQKFKCIAWEMATDNYDFRRSFLDKYSKEGFSTYKSKENLYKDLVAILDGYILSDENKSDIVENGIKSIVNLIGNSSLKYWNEATYNEFKDKIKTEIGTNKIVVNSRMLLGQDVKKIYEKLYENRNKLAHNTSSYQYNLPTLNKLKEEKFGYNNYFVWFYLLIIIDDIMIRLYKQFEEKKFKLELD